MSDPASSSGEQTARPARDSGLRPCPGPGEDGAAEHLTDARRELCGLPASAAQEVLTWLDEVADFARAVGDALDEPAAGAEVPGGGEHERVRMPPGVEGDACTPDFLEEAEDRLDAAERALLDLVEDPSDLGQVNAAFRAFHTIKGMAGFLALDAVVGLAHAAEELLDAARKGAITLAPGHVDLLLAAGRLLHELDEALGGGQAPTVRRLETLIGRLERAARGEDPAGFPPGSAAPGPGATPQPGAGAGSAAEAPLRLGDLLLQRGLLTRRALELALAEQRETGRRLGETLVDLGLVTEDDIRLALRVQRGRGSERSFDKLPLGEVLVRLSILTPRALAAGLREQYMTGRHLGETLVDLGLVSQEEIDRALALQAASEERQREALGIDPEQLIRELSERMAEEREEAVVGREEVLAPGVSGTVKVEAERLDDLIGLAVELSVAHRGLLRHDALPGLAGSGFAADLGELGQRIRAAQDAAVAIRLVPLEATFRRMALLARETASRLGKEARVVIEGEHNGLDRAVVEELAGALVHLVRNAVDHGLEDPQARRAAGKPARGLVLLRARQHGASFVIEVADDGAGIDTGRVVESARACGLLPADLDASEVDAEGAFNLLCLPGLSTSEAVGEVSGRGVGMDVVRRVVERMGGRLRVHSEPGRGTRILATLPLTMVALQVQILTVAGEVLCVPAEQLVTEADLRAEGVRALPDGTEVVSWDGALVPLLRAASLVGHRAPGPHDGVDLVGLCSDGVRVALLADGRGDVRRLVVRGGHPPVPGAAGRALLGGGEEIPLLDAASLAQRAQESRFP